MLRGGWEEKIGRPLTLVVVDEAHNLSQEQRGLKLELLLATINRECRYAQFLLLTPFIDNADEIARWLSPDSYNQIELGLDWLPNDRAIVLSTAKRSAPKSKNFTIELKTIHTNRQTIDIAETITLEDERILGLKWSDVSKSPNKLAAATAQLLKKRGSVIILAKTIPDTWKLASHFTKEANSSSQESEDIQLVQRFLQEEFSPEFPLINLLQYGVGVHHSGLSDEARTLIEWLFEKGSIQVLVTTTTIAQGVNFPVSNVVLASHQYPYGKNMPAEDFWNLAGRAGRVNQSSVGIIALAANNQEKADKLTEFVNQKVESLSSTLVSMVQKAIKQWGQLELHLLYKQPEWSSFLQYLAHTYRQIGNHERFVTEVEQVLRGTLGFQALRRKHPQIANSLVNGVRGYAERISNRPLSLVDNTGFSWESVSITLSRLHDERINQEVWDADSLFVSGSPSLKKLLEILQDIPELNQNLEQVIGGARISKTS
ncbi:DEAD/DEAH box helicase [Kamptonema formosum]|uniref:DEAD/DEAH box helicase n=1 Tax=Kamptonema formosum TaxID=331992 RepID=UPI00034644B7|nr:helicase-related protein [Kamptonema formosum]